MPRPKIRYGVLPYADNTEYVTLRKVNGSTGATTDYADVLAKAKMVSETVIDPAGVQTVVQRTTWHLDVRSLQSHNSTLVPDRDDRIVSTSDVWSGTYVIFSVNTEAIGTRYRCETQKLLS